MSEDSQHSVNPESPVPDKPKWRYRFWIKLLIVVLVLYYTPLLGYVWRLGEAVAEHGFSRQTLPAMARHTDWFKRYFTGPSSDDDMIAFFHRHRADLERAAYFYAHHGYCHNRQTPADKQECEQLQERTGMRVFGSRTLPNTVYRRSEQGCGADCDVQDHYFHDMEPQDWWRSWNGEIKAWQKSLLYVPSLMPADLLGYNPKHYPDDPLEVMRRDCYRKNSLDSVPPELEKIEDAPLLNDKCATRHIEGQWFIVLRPVVKSWKN